MLTPNPRGQDKQNFLPISIKNAVVVTLLASSLTLLSGCDLVNQAMKMVNKMMGKETEETSDSSAEEEPDADAAPGNEESILFGSGPSPEVRNYRPIAVVMPDGIKVEGTLYVPGISPYTPPAVGEGEEAAAEENAGEETEKKATQEVITPAKTQYPLVILLHMLSGDRWDWKEYPRHLLEQGYAVLAIDLRGHGASVYRGKILRVWRGFDVKTWQKIPTDIGSLTDYISKQKEFNMVNTKQLSLVGASIGANAAIMYAGAHPSNVKALVVLSPGLEYHGLMSLEPMMNYEGPIYFAASQQDSYAAESTQKLYKYALGKKKVKIFEDIGHGTDMLDNNPDLGRDIIDWLKGIVPTPGGKPVVMAEPNKPGKAPDGKTEASKEEKSAEKPVTEAKSEEKKSSEKDKDKKDKKSELTSKEEKKSTDKKSDKKTDEKKSEEKKAETKKTDDKKSTEKPAAKPAEKPKEVEPTTETETPKPVEKKTTATIKAVPKSSTTPSKAEIQKTIEKSLEVTKTPIPQTATPPPPPAPAAHPEEH